MRKKVSLMMCGTFGTTKPVIGVEVGRWRGDWGGGMVKINFLNDHVENFTKMKEKSSY